MENLYMLVIDNERIKKLRNPLADRKYRIYRSGRSLSIYIREEKGKVINNINSSLNTLI